MRAEDEEAKREMAEEANSTAEPRGEEEGD